MTGFDHILNWKLLSGSHEFPGPDGGTCINEAAIVAAGFEYKSVGNADDCPPCFSRVLSRYAIQLNDRLPDDQRQKLLTPFVTRLAGTADSSEVERMRAEFLVLGLVRDVVTIALSGWMDESANDLARVKTTSEAAAAVKRLGTKLIGALALDLARALALARARARALALARARDLDLDLDLAQVNIAAVNLLDGAMKIGKQAEPIETALVCQRMDEIRRKVPAWPSTPPPAEKENLMLAYHNDESIKTAILARLRAHREADEIVKGQYWKNGKGCAVGCALHSGEHAEYETRFGIPRVLAHLEDRLFEKMSNAKAQEWPERFMGAIRVGSDLAMVWPRFALWLLDEFIPPAHVGGPESTAALAGVVALYREWCETGKCPARDRWVAAAAPANASSAYAAYATTYPAYADPAAASSACACASAHAAAGYVAACADSAAHAAAGYVAACAAYATHAAHAAAANAAYAAGQTKPYETMADKLVELIEVSA